jgi:hypothetical protein
MSAPIPEGLILCWVLGFFLVAVLLLHLYGSPDREAAKKKQAALDEEEKNMEQKRMMQSPERIHNLEEMLRKRRSLQDNIEEIEKAMSAKEVKLVYNHHRGAMCPYQDLDIKRCRGAIEDILKKDLIAQLALIEMALENEGVVLGNGKETV